MSKPTIPALTDADVRGLTGQYKLLADESRLRIVNLLAQDGELNVTQICAALGQSQPAVSHHLALLRVSGLSECRRQGKNNFYSLTPLGLAVASQWASLLEVA